MKMVTKALLVSIWFMILTFPLMGITINTINQTVIWRLDRVGMLGIGIFVISLLCNIIMQRQKAGNGLIQLPAFWVEKFVKIPQNPRVKYSFYTILAASMICMPFVSSMYQTNIMISALLYVILALGLNIAVGLAGQLVLGYIAFYAVGAYTYAILHQFFGFGFWLSLPLGGLSAIFFGLIVGFPVLRLRGDYLAIATLGFGEIVRISLLNLSDITGGARGMSNIPAPSFFGLEMDLTATTTYIYYLVLIAVIISIITIIRIKHSRVGLALQALREDEIACEAMGIDLTRIKLSAFALSSCWAGFAGVIFASKTSFINPSSFTFMDSIMVLSMVVLGGMGSIVGVIIAAFILILVPEYLRAFSEYRMLIFGAVMVLMMIFKPKGLITSEKRTYNIPQLQNKKASTQEAK